MTEAFISDFGPMHDVPRWVTCVDRAAPKRRDGWYDLRFRVSKTAARAHRHMQRRAFKRYELGGFAAVKSGLNA